MLISTSNFFKDNQLLEPVGQVQFLVFKKIFQCFIHHIAREIMILLVNNVHEKTSQKVKMSEILEACARYL